MLKELSLKSCQMLMAKNQSLKRGLAGLEQSQEVNNTKLADVRNK